MINQILLYTGSSVITLWGVAHIFPTRGVVEGFGPLSADNRRIITMEWVAEGLTLSFIGLLVLSVTVFAGVENPGSIIVYRASAAMAIILAGWSLFTGFRTSILPMKLCPFIKTAVAILFLLGSVI